MIRALILAALCATATAQLTQQSPLPWGQDIRRICYVTPTHWVAAAMPRRILDSTDAGRTWTQRFSNPNSFETFDTVVFTDEFHGFAGGGGGTDAYYTINGGATWLAASNWPAGSVNDVCVLDGQRAFLGLNGASAYTADAGRTWQIRGVYPDNPITFGTDFRDENVGLTGGIRSTPHNDESIYRTTDGGLTWTPVYDNSVNDVVWISPTSALAIDGRNIIRSDDEGLTWFPWFLGIDTGLGEMARAGNSDVICGVSLGGAIWRSADQGASWVQVVEGIGTLPQSWYITFLDESRGYVTGPDGEIYTTADAGATWAIISSGIIDEVTGMGFIDRDNGLAVTQNRFVLRTTDGGNFWQVSKLGFTGLVWGRDEYFKCMHMLPSGFAVVAGAGGLIFKTPDGGESWQSVGYPLNFPANANFTTVHFLDENTGFISGSGLGRDSGLYKTIDGGINWTPVAGMPAAYSSIQFIGQHGWLGTQSAAFIYRTDDGGATWQLAPLPGEFLSGTQVRFADINTGYASSWYGYLAGSTDGGRTWTRFDRNQDENYYDISVVSPQEAWVVGAERLGSTFSLHTTDGGLHWTRSNIPQSPYGLSQIEALPSGKVWMGGYAGHIWTNTAPPLRIIFPQNIPAALGPDAPTDCLVRVYSGQQDLDPASPMLYFRPGAAEPFQAVPLAPLGGDDFTATFPAVRCDATPQFYFEARSTTGTVVRSPANAPASVHTAPAGAYEIGPLLAETFDVSTTLPAGWSASGLWHLSGVCSPGGSCGNSNTSRRMYYGRDTGCNYSTGIANRGVLATPQLTLPTLLPGQTLSLRFCSALRTENWPAILEGDVVTVWFSETVGQRWLIEVVMDSANAGFAQRTYDMARFAGKRGRIEWDFDTRDERLNTYRGWMVDNIEIIGPRLVCTDPYCPADFDGSGGVDGADVEAFFTAWEAGGQAGDTNRDGSTDGSDVEAFFTAWEAGGC